MGTIAAFDLQDMREKYNIRHFIETGTGSGDALEFAARYPFFDDFMSCEIERELTEKARLRFKHNPAISIVEMESHTFIQHVCKLIPENEPILFWLDAHFPGADYGIKSYDFTKDTDIRLPLMEELRHIIRMRPNGRDVIICDDLRIYMDGPFRHGNLPSELRHLCPAGRNVDFVVTLTQNTHDLTLRYDHEGYILLTPI